MPKANFSLLASPSHVLSKSPLSPLAIAFVSGILMGLATAPLNFFPIAWVALAPLWIMVFSDRNHPHTPHPTPHILALAWGIGYHGFALSWITGLHPLTWLGMSWLASAAVTLFCWVFITLWGAGLVVVWVWLVRWIERGVRSQESGARRGKEEGKTRGRGDTGTTQNSSHTLYPTPYTPTQNLKLKTQNTSPFLRILFATAIWCSLEWLWSLGSLYWTSLSYTQSPGNLLILHLGRLSGPSTVTAAIVAVNGLIAEAWISYQQLAIRQQKSGVRSQESGARDIESTSETKTNTLRNQGLQLKTQNSKLKTQNSKLPLHLLLTAALFLLSLHLIGFSLYRQPLIQPSETALKVGIVQGNVPTRIKLSSEGVRRAIGGYTTGYEMLADQGVDAVLTPEGALPVLWDEKSKKQNAFYQAVVSKGVAAWLGTFVAQDEQITQSLLSLAGNGETVGRYNKIKLVPLGEYVPFRSVFGKLIDRLSPIEADMLPGTAAQRFNTPFGPAIASICYESAFPELFRAQAADGGQFILTASNLDPYSEVLMAQHQAQDLMRAIETDRWAVRATNTGYSGIINPHGKIIWRSQAKTYEVHADTIYRRQNQTPYVRWGDWLTPLLVGIAGTFWFFPWMQKRNFNQ